MSYAVLARKAFSVSRLAEFASVPELARQTGQPPRNWPLVVVKELVDNAIDAAEEAGQAPVVDIRVEFDGSIVVADQGPGLAPKIVTQLVDYAKRTSSRAAYVSPTRGAQGNALQALVAMPYVLDGERGQTLIESRGLCHRIVFAVDPLRQTPRVEHAKGPSAVKIGTKVTVSWPTGRRRERQNFIAGRPVRVVQSPLEPVAR
jgi:DNA topoisomerase VI subunit B